MTTPPQVATMLRMPENPYLKRAAEALPGYREALELLADADEYLRNISAPQKDSAELDPLRSGTISPEWHDALDAAEAAAARYEKHRHRTLTIKQRAIGRATSILTSGVNLMLCALDDELTRLKSEVKDVERRLGGASTSDEAIALGVAPDWRKLQADLAPEYATLRDAQTYLLLNVAPRSYWTSCRPPLGGENHASVAWIRNLPQLWPDFRQPGLSSTRINLDGSQHREEPWPTDDGPQFLLWAIRSGAELWIPTLRQIDQLFRDLRQRDNPDSDQPAQPDAEHYFDRITDQLTIGAKVVATPAEIAARRAEMAQLGAPK